MQDAVLEEAFGSAPRVWPASEREHASFTLDHKVQFVLEPCPPELRAELLPELCQPEEESEAAQAWLAYWSPVRKPEDGKLAKRESNAWREYEYVLSFVSR